jgi:hypothetical protein
MSKDELKEAIKELFDDEEFVSKFSKSFTSNMLNQFLNDLQTQFKNIFPKEVASRSGENESCGFTCGISCLHTAQQPEK